MFQESRQGAVVVVSDNEPLDHTRVDEARTVFERYGAIGAPMAVYDLSSVAFVDSAGLEFLLDTSEQFRNRGGDLKLANPNPVCLDTLRITGVGQELEVYDQTSNAVRSFLR